MSIIRKLLLALILSAGLAPAFAQAPPPVPALPDAERRTSYALSSQTGPVSVGFALYGDGTDYTNWLQVFVNGVLLPQAGGWTLSSPTGSLAVIPRPITDGQITFLTAQTGTIQIVGARRPRVTTQFAENAGVSARDLNQRLTDMAAQERERWDTMQRVLQGLPGETINLMPSATSRANGYLAFDTNGNPAVAVPAPPAATLIAGPGINLSGTGPVTISTTSTNTIGPPQGRLTLANGVANPTSDVAAAGTLYYTPAIGGGFMPITADGSTFSMVQFADVSQATTDATKSPAATVANANYDILCWVDSGSNRCTRSDYWKMSSTATVTVASPAVATWSGSAFNTNYNPPCVWTTTGSLPTGFTVGTTYYLLGSSVSGATFRLSATPGGTAINTTGTQSGTHTLTCGDDVGLAYRVGTTSLTKAGGGILLNTNAVTNGPGALRGTYVGTVRTDASALLNMTFGSPSPGGGPALLNVWNLYNQVSVSAIVGDNTPTWTYAGAGRMMNNSAGNRVSFVKGLPTEDVQTNRGYNVALVSINQASSFNGYAMDSVTALDRSALSQVQTATASFAPPNYGVVVGKYKALTGAHFIQAIESGDGSHTATFSGAAQGAFLEVSTWQ